MKDYLFKPLVFLIISGVLVASIKSGTQAEKYKSIWYETESYPINANPPDWDNYNLQEYLDILNPPDDLIHRFSSEKLAELMLEYPMLWTIRTYPFEELDCCFDYFERNCDVFSELIRRDGGIMTLLKAYRDNGFTSEDFDGYECPILEFNQKIDAEAFLCQFVNYYFNYFSDEEKIAAEEIIEIKTDVYSDIKDSFTNIYFEFEKHDFESYLFSDEYKNIGYEQSDENFIEDVSSKSNICTDIGVNTSSIIESTEAGRRNCNSCYIVTFVVFAVLGIVLVVSDKSKK